MNSGANRPNVVIVGAGAIGGLIGARLAALGTHRVVAWARGDTLSALQAHGWRVQSGDERLQVPAEATDRIDEVRGADLVIVAVKAQALPAVAGALGAMLAPHTLVLPAMNGVPWWFTHGTVLEGAPLDSVDPGGRIAAAVPAAQVLGAVVHVSASRLEPGIVHHAIGNGLIVGEPGGGRSERVERVAAMLAGAGFDVTRSDDVRRDLWYKLWGNLTMNPVSAITGATIDRLLADPLVRGFCSAAMSEAAAIGARIGCPIGQTPDDRHAITARLGAFKTSMLQDVEAGRPTELDAIVGALHEIGRRLAVPTPTIDALYGLARLHARMRGLYPAA